MAGPGKQADAYPPSLLCVDDGSRLAARHIGFSRILEAKTQLPLGCIRFRRRAASLPLQHKDHLDGVFFQLPQVLQHGVDLKQPSLDRPGQCSGHFRDDMTPVRGVSVLFCTRLHRALTSIAIRDLRHNQRMNNKWTRIIVIALGALIVIALLIRVFFSQALQDLVNGG
jgi:hypothetical protein